MTQLSSQLNANFHSGAADVRSLAWGDPADAWLPTSWQQSLTDLSFSVTALWDAIVAAVMIPF